MLRENAAVKAAGLDAVALAKTIEDLLGRFPNAQVNPDEQRRLRAAIYKPLLALPPEARPDRRSGAETAAGGGRRMKSSLYPIQDLHRRVLAWALKLKVNPRVVRVQAMRRKWGSCTSAGTVTLAADLLDQDERFQDYVIVHELLHLRYPSHG
ncbi:MAG: M48 family metallopeptidase, partial [Thiobacillaceae bacterium]